MRKICLAAFNGEAMCFAHVLLNALDYQAKGYEVSVAIEGTACKQIKEMAENNNPFHALWEQVKEKALISGVCRACAQKMGSLQVAEEQRLPILDQMKGHLPLEKYTAQGYDIYIF